MPPEAWSLYHTMLRSRLFEEAVAKLWHDGAISGEMHLGTGEEAIVAGVVAHLREGDALALDHRATAALLLRGVEPVPILREILGREDGLCKGRGGHMHLFSKARLAASSGIVGATGPAAAGFALAAQFLRPGGIAVAFFGDGAMNQGMLLESLNLAAAWRLPVLFVCKDDGWAITTQTGEVTGGSIAARAQAFGIAATGVDGADVIAVWNAAGSAIEHARSGAGPHFLHARCVHLEAHFLGFPLLRAVRDPLREAPGISAPVIRSLVRPGGAPLGERLAGLKAVLGSVVMTLRDPRREPANDPVVRAREKLSSEPARLRELEERVEAEISEIVSSAIAGGAP